MLGDTFTTGMPTALPAANALFPLTGKNRDARNPGHGHCPERGRISLAAGSAGGAPVVPTHPNNIPNPGHSHCPERGKISLTAGSAGGAPVVPAHPPTY